MQSTTTTCDVCQRTVSVTSNWFVAITSPATNGIAFGPADAEYASGLTLEHICGEMCMHVRLTRWAESRYQNSEAA